MSLDKHIEAVRNSFRADLDSFSDDIRTIDELRIKYFGRKGLVADLFGRLKDIAGDQKPKIGKMLNELRQELTAEFESRTTGVKSLLDKKQAEQIDYTLPGYYFPAGSIHPIQQTLDEMKEIFQTIGFNVAYGPEIDDDWHNFEALNFPPHHPARDMQDTFFVDEKTVLRTHTSNVQIHLMENNQPPLRYLIPGKVYRNEAISFKHYCLFHQVEGLYVDKNVSFADLKGTVDYFLRKMFGPNVKARFRPSYFPFTEPSAEVDIWNEQRQQWMEIVGCGMVDPNVFRNIGYDPQIWHGFAFGFGVERIAMLKYKIDDIR
ncbi:MAG: phenylalanine--tRNA ligase subunit alpha, partial [Candidatus Neomarinimicrobiota bacterium]